MDIKVDKHVPLYLDSCLHVLRTHISNPGVFVSWQPDNENEESYINRNNQQIETLLDMLAEIISQESEDEDSELSAVEVRDHWIIWPYDSAFRYSRLPDKNLGLTHCTN